MKLSAKEITYVSMFTGLTAIGAFISIPLGDVPVTMQTLFVLLSGLVLGPRLASLSQVAYMFLGLAGLPIFSAFTGGIQAIVRPSFGFVIGFVFASYVVGNIAHSGRFSHLRICLAGLAGTLVIYLFGLPYMYYILNTVMVKSLSFSAVVKIGCLVFLPGDIIKLGLSSILAIKILPRLKHSHLYL